MKNILLILLVSIGYLSVHAQITPHRTYKDTLQKINKEHDGELEEVELPEMVIDISKESLQRIRTMQILRRRILRVYPYVAVASKNLNQIYDELEKIPSNSDRKKYIKSQEERLKAQFEKPLKKLSRKDGRILVKLLYRQTGKSTYKLMQELKSGWSAFWANKMAWFYDINLKESYEPYDQLEDFYIEYILNDLRTSRKINYEDPELQYNLSALKNKWKTTLGDSDYYPESIE